nr:hypothetical protein [uncultured Chryseobacterium sp.]
MELKTKYMIIRITLIIFSILLLDSCKSIAEKPTGKWKLSSVINSDDVYANRSSLVPQQVESDLLITLTKDGAFTANHNLCYEGAETTSEGKYYMPKYKKIDKTLRLELSKCPGIDGAHYIRLREKKLELYYPSVAGYRIQIFEKIK